MSTPISPRQSPVRASQLKPPRSRPQGADTSSPTAPAADLSDAAAPATKPPVYIDWPGVWHNTKKLAIPVTGVVLMSALTIAMTFFPVGLIFAIPLLVAAYAFLYGMSRELAPITCTTPPGTPEGNDGADGKDAAADDERVKDAQTTARHADDVRADGARSAARPAPADVTSSAQPEDRAIPDEWLRSTGKSPFTEWNGGRSRPEVLPDPPKRRGSTV